MHCNARTRIVAVRCDNTAGRTTDNVSQQKSRLQSVLAATAGDFKTHDYLSYRNLASLLPRPMRALRCRMAMRSSFASSSYTAPTTPN